MPDDRKEQAVDSVVSLAKAEGAFLASAGGDALGWPQEMRGARASGTPPRLEFQAWTRRSGGRFRPYEEAIDAGGYSDDTQLLLAVARSRTTYGPGWWKGFATVELPLWTLYERGGGGATKRAARAWAGGGPPWKTNKNAAVQRYFDAGGNGVAMRVLPHALFLAGVDDPSELVRDVMLDGTATHGHPRALVGAVAYAYAAWWLARRTGTLAFGELLDWLLDNSPAWGTFPSSERGGGTWLTVAEKVTASGYERVWAQTVAEMRGLFETARRGIRVGALADDHAVLTELGCFGDSKGAGTVAAAAAAYLTARHAAQPKQGVLRAAFEFGADTDTLAAMTGGLMGCLAGVEWIPGPWLDVQDAEYLRHMASRVAAGPAGMDGRTVPPRPDPRIILSELTRQGNGDLVLGEGMRARAEALTNPKAIARSIAVRAWKLKTIEGQTLYITRVSDLPGRSRARRPDHKKAPANAGTPEPPIAAPAVVSPSSDSPPAEVLYAGFRKQLQNVLRKREMGRSEIQAALGLVSSQVDTWLKRAEEEGAVSRASRRPVTFALPRKPLL